jgi:hypothetical protein
LTPRWGVWLCARGPGRCATGWLVCWTGCRNPSTASTPQFPTRRFSAGWTCRRPWLAVSLCRNRVCYHAPAR